MRQLYKYVFIQNEYKAVPLNCVYEGWLPLWLTIGQLRVQWSSSGDEYHELMVYINPNNIYQCCLTKNSCYYKSNSVILAYRSMKHKENYIQLQITTF